MKSLLLLSSFLCIDSLQINAQPTGYLPNEYQVVYLVHLKFYAAWPWRHEKAPKHTPRYVLSLDTVHLEINNKFKYSSAGIKREPTFSNGIIADAIEVRFPKGDTLLAKFSTTFNRFGQYSILNRKWDSTFQITNAKQNDFYFIANRGLPRAGRNNYQLAWRLFDNNHTRKALVRRLKKVLKANTVYTITIQ